MERLRHLDFFPSDGSTDPTPPRFSARLASAVGAVLVGFGVLVASTGDLDSVARQLIVQFNRFAPAPAAVDPDTLEQERVTLTRLRDLPSHPAVMHQPYLSHSVFAGEDPDSSISRRFHDLLDLFRHRLGVDDNFTIRVVDTRTYDVLEVYVLDELRDAYRNGKAMEWRRVDDYRRAATRRLVDKYVRRGVPREAITVKWGRAHQIEEAHDRDQPTLQYEVQLANYLGLSLLPTEIGTVETFNQDDMVSPAGARSRYQMMPWILRRSGVNTYSLRTERGNWVKVREEWHPLLTLEPAFTLLRGYVNAVGHEIPGISAYHTGPGNIYKLYRLYLTESKHFGATSSVVDAFMWGLTDGFERVDEVSTFGTYSRGYVPSTYGALKAVDDRPLDPSRTLKTARVQLEPGRQVTLHTLLGVLDSTGVTLDWGENARGATSLYEKFRTLNPHIDLPASSDGEPSPGGNVRFTASVDGKAVRFFLPLGAPEVLRAAGVDVLDDAATFRFDASTYTGAEAQKTKWDRKYDALVDDIARFGFTPANRSQLLALHDTFVELAERTPTHFRRIQLDVIRTHRRIWLSNPWEELSDVAMLATGRVRMPVQPPVALETRTSVDGAQALDD